MSSRRAARKTVDYSQFCDELEDYSGDDDDFQDSPNQPPAKKTRSSKPSPKKSSKKDKTKKGISEKKVSLPEKTEVKKEVQSPRPRLSIGDKVFNRDLQIALELSQDKSNSTKTPDRHLDDNGVTEGDSKNEKTVEGEDKNDVDTVGKNSNKPLCNDESGEDDSDYQVEEEEEDSEDVIASEDSEDEYDAPKRKSKKLPAKTNRKQSSESKKTTTKNKSSTSISKEQKVKTSINKAGLPSRKAGLVNNGLIKSSLSATPNILPKNKTTIAQGETVTCRPISSGLSKSSPSSGLGGVHVRQGTTGGIRVGLSRNIRVSKPLHPNASFGT